MADKKKTFTRNLNMADRRKQIEEIYGGSDEGLRRLFGQASGSNLSQLFTEESLDRLINQVGLETISREDITNISNFAYSTDSNYSTIINYFADMFLWRYYYFPVQVRDTANESDYGDIYNLMTDIVDGMAIETTFPLILTKLLKEGVVYLYTQRNTPSKTVSTIILNPEYCKPLMMSQYGTGIYQFDVQYFDDLGFRDEALEEVLQFFPDELVNAYRQYKTGGSEYQFIIVDGRFSTYIQLNENNFPDRLSVLRSLFDYRKYRENEVERSSAQLDRVITHKIPSHEGNLLFELPEVKALHRSMSRIITNNNTNRRTRLMTTFGEVQVHPMQAESSVQNQSLEQGHSTVFRTAGVNSALFAGATKESLEISLTRDQSYVWRHIQQLINFYNLTINNLYNFKGYQIELTMLPITHYNAREGMEMYRRNAEYGIGRIESVVASGTKQKHIAHKSKLEEFLKLDEVLKPLESAHTRSGKDQDESPKDEDQPTDEEKPDDQVEDNQPEDSEEDE